MKYEIFPDGSTPGYIGDSHIDQFIALLDAIGIRDPATITAVR